MCFRKNDQLRISCKERMCQSTLFPTPQERETSAEHNDHTESQDTHCRQESHTEPGSTHTSVDVGEGLPSCTQSAAADQTRNAAPLVSEQDQARAQVMGYYFFSKRPVCIIYISNLKGREVSVMHDMHPLCVYHGEDK